MGAMVLASTQDDGAALALYTAADRSPQSLRRFGKPWGIPVERLRNNGSALADALHRSLPTGSRKPVRLVQSTRMSLPTTDATKTDAKQSGNTVNHEQNAESRKNADMQRKEGVEKPGKEEKDMSEIGQTAADGDTTITDATADHKSLQSAVELPIPSSPQSKAQNPHSDATLYQTAESGRTSQSNLKEKEKSSPRPNGEEPQGDSESKLPALLLRMGPAIAETDTNHIKGSSLIRPAGPSTTLPPRPRVDTWMPADIRALRPLRSHTDSYIPPAADSYIAPRSPSPKRYDSHGNGSARRRRDWSPARARDVGDRLWDMGRSARRDDSERRVQRSPREEEHYSTKRRRTEGDSYRAGDEDPRRHSHDHRSRDSDSRHRRSSRSNHDSRYDHDPRPDHDSRHERDSRTDYKNSRYHRREDSAERRTHDDHAGSEERRDRRRSDYREDLRPGDRTHGNGDVARYSVRDRERGVGDEARDRRDAGSDRQRKEVEEYAETRNSRSLSERSRRPTDDHDLSGRANGRSADSTTHTYEGEEISIVLSRLVAHSGHLYRSRSDPLRTAR